MRLVRGFFRAGKPAGVICHGPWTLVEANVVRGRTLTSLADPGHRHQERRRHLGSGCPAVGWEHKNLAILGHSAGSADGCVAAHPSDLAVALTALAAGARGRPGQADRPGRRPAPPARPRAGRDTVLKPGELITTVELPPPPAGRSAYRKVRERASFAFALVSVAAPIDVAGCRVALGGAAHVPWRAFAAERSVLGAPATAETFARAAHAELRQAVLEPPGHPTIPRQTKRADMPYPLDGWMAVYPGPGRQGKPATRTAGIKEDRWRTCSRS